MKIGNTLKETNNVPKLCVCVYLLEERLREPIPILFILLFRPVKDLFLVAPHSLVGQVRLTVSARLLAKPDGVSPNRRTVRPFGKGDIYRDIRITPSGQAAYFGHSSTVLDGLLQASSLRLCNVSKKAEYIQKIRFPGSIWSHNELPVAQAHVYVLKVAPVLHGQMF